MSDHQKYVSASQMTTDRAIVFTRKYQPSCFCPLELRLESGGTYECAKCGRPVYLRKVA